MSDRLKQTLKGDDIYSVDRYRVRTGIAFRDHRLYRTKIDYGFRQYGLIGPSFPPGKIRHHLPPRSPEAWLVRGSVWSCICYVGDPFISSDCQPIDELAAVFFRSR